MLEALDRKIIEKLTKFSHWFQKLTGLTCYFFAKVGLFIAIFGLLVNAVNYFKPILSYENGAFGIFALFFLGFRFSADVYKCSKAEENIFSSGEHVKIERSPVWLRMLWFMSFIMSVIFFISRIDLAHYKIIEAIGCSGVFLGPLVFLYFVEVTPLPPGKSKVCQWVEGLFSAQPQLEPVPIKSDK